MCVVVDMCVLWQAYDQHLNMVLGDVEETITTVEVDDETYEEIIKVRSGCVCLVPLAPADWILAGGRNPFLAFGADRIS
jgi:hypothetical protein